MQLTLKQLGKRYTLLRLLDSGNMADVYLAQDEEEKHQVAIKVIKPDMHYSEIFQRFAREGNLAASLDHSHIIRTYSCEEEKVTIADETSDGELKILYIVMEYIEGGNLKQWLKQQKPLSLTEILRIMEQLCAAVQYLHFKGVIHRDIKPANVLFREPPQEGKQIEVVLSDFGLALLAEDTHVSLPQAGTPAYMAPEQWFGHPKLASDIFSLGVVFYQLCTGHKPSSSRPLETPTSLNPSLPPVLDEVILRALSNDPLERFTGASLFWQAIQSAVTTTAQSSALPLLTPPGVTTSKPLPQPLPLKTGVSTQPLPTEPEPASPLIPAHHIPQPNRYRPLLVAAALIVATIFLVSLALPVVGVLLAAPTGAAPPSTITIAPATLTVQQRYVLQGLTSNANPTNRQVVVRQLTSTKTDTKTVNLAHFHQDAKSATGKITLFNGSSSALTVSAGTIIQVGNEKIAIDEQAVIPAARLIPGSAPQYGQRTVRAHVVQGGSAGNITASSINQFCCDGSGRIAAENQEAFTGGSNVIDYNYLKQEDVNAVTNANQGVLATNAQTDIKGQIKAGEKLVGAINCASPNTTEDLQPNASQPITVTVAHVTVSVSCSAQVTDGNGVQAIVQKALQDQASQSPGAPYTQAGAIAVTEPRSPQIQQDGSVTFSVTAKGIWYYPWTTAMMQDVLNKVKGMSKAQAQSILNSYPGVGQASIILTNGTTLLPIDPTLIMLSVSTVAGLPAGK